MKTAQPGDIVTVVYDGLLDNGEVFETSTDTGPLEFHIGTGSVMAAFEEAVIGMTANETKEIVLSPEATYGAHRPELVHSISRSFWDDNADIRPGVVVGMNMEKDGVQHTVPAMVTSVAGDNVTIDFNHPLAGKSITYRITLQKIRSNRPAQTNAAGGCGCAS
ncbi:MAG: FKBP-type peptidyl-prolyl cis-trans isomerase [Thermodesulfobacteriota bacterium]